MGRGGGGNNRNAPPSGAAHAGRPPGKHANLKSCARSRANPGS